MTQPPFVPDPHQYPQGYGQPVPTPPYRPVKPLREETSAGRPLLWAAAWGGLGAFLSIAAALLLLYLLIMLFVAGISDSVSMSDTFTGLGRLGSEVPVEVLAILAGVCAVAAVLSMGALLVLRMSATVRRWRPVLQGLAAAATAYAVGSAASSVLGSVAQIFVGT